jgi:hypothetical protein
MIVKLTNGDYINTDKIKRLGSISRDPFSPCRYYFEIDNIEISYWYCLYSEEEIEKNKQSEIDAEKNCKRDYNKIKKAMIKNEVKE